MAISFDDRLYRYLALTAIIGAKRTRSRKKRQRKEQAIKIFCKTSPIRAFHVGRSSRALRRLLERGEKSPLIALNGASAPQ
jgi:hypothetical protein